MSDAPATAPVENWLEYFHVTFFAIVMGLAGLTLALHAGEAALGLPAFLSAAAYYASVAVFLVIALVYAAKGLRHRAAVVAEWRHPVKLAFFPAISISLLLLATASLGRADAVAEPLWLLGAGLQTVLTLAVVTGWIGNRSFLHGHLSPAWFIPAVGNVIVPIAGVQLGYEALSWYFMSVGLVFWIVLLTLVFNRLVFHDPLPGRLQPTLVILIAPPAVGFVAWVRLMGEVDAFALILLNAAYFFTLLVAVQLPRIARLPFALSFWALSFPFAAVTIASFVQAGTGESAAHRMIGAGLLAVLVLIIAALVLRTLKAIVAGDICKPE
ncbi:C4-dicarboxylate ABC transporter [Rhodobacteraceae bacterium W635]|uniref:SLAC1 anion channel family protein n=1 Tax=Nioella halotolerans TaxID=2303578 RepID=UPI000E3EA2F3|nr:C4-dicarboxylate ABC transporter [Rhodobacteraceae bacterium W635]